MGRREMGIRTRIGKYYRGRKINQGTETGLTDQIQEWELKVC